jgi:hypothetical protein
MPFNNSPDQPSSQEQGIISQFAPEYSTLMDRIGDEKDFRNMMRPIVGKRKTSIYISLIELRINQIKCLLPQIENNENFNGTVAIYNQELAKLGVPDVYIKNLRLEYQTKLIARTALLITILGGITYGGVNELNRQATQKQIALEQQVAQKKAEEAKYSFENDIEEIYIDPTTLISIMGTKRDKQLLETMSPQNKDLNNNIIIIQLLMQIKDYQTRKVTVETINKNNWSPILVTKFLQQQI